MLRIIASLSLFAAIPLLGEAPNSNNLDNGPGVRITGALPSETPAFTYRNALILGIVEGVTEFLPISSTGHLILTNRLLDLDREVAVVRHDGEPLWRIPPAPGTEDQPPQRGIPVYYKDAVDAYAIVIQGGAILAVVLLYHARLLSMFFGILGRDPNGRRLTRNLILSFLPAACLGLIFESWINRHLFGPGPVLAALVAGALLMLAVERWRRRRYGAVADAPAGPDLHELGARQALLIGFLQCLAMWPGTSRSMITIVGGYLAGLHPTRAAEYSFLLGLITLTAASGYKAVKDGAIILEVLEPGPVIFGCFAAFIAALLAVKGLVAYLSRHSLDLFAYYRLGLAAVMALVIFG